MARRSETPHRHTVPNSSYAFFPCFQEELKLKTNLLKCDTADGAADSAQDNFQVNVSMHDKLKMCFAEMETMKDQFEAKRNKLNRKRMKKECADNFETAQSKTRPSSSLATEGRGHASKETRKSLFDTVRFDALMNLQLYIFLLHLGKNWNNVTSWRKQI